MDYRTTMKRSLLTLLVLMTVGIWAYNLGTFHSIKVDDQRKEVGCSEITRHEDGALICEVFLRPSVAGEDVDVTAYTEQGI